MRTIIAMLLLSSIIWADIEYGSFEFDGHERSYIVFLPENYEPALPVVFSLHGYGADAESEMSHTRMNEVADTANFVVVYPNATETIWNSGIGDNPYYPTPEVDDVAFISALIDTIYAEYQTDRQRVYACGLSNGGFMSFRLAAELSERFTKIAAVSAVLTPTIVTASSTYSPIPLLLLNGTADPVVPYSGGSTGWYSVEQTLEYWLDANSCSMVSDTLVMPDIDTGDNCTVEVISYRDCRSGENIYLYKVIGGGHLWPGSGSDFYDWGPINEDISASAHIWNFFNSESYEIHGVWVDDLMVNANYVDPAVDGLEISAAITNTHDHAYEAYAILRNMDNTLVDSFQLFDDGLHNDGDAGDGLAKALVPSLQMESDFYIQATTLNLDYQVYLGPHEYALFTTIGPLSFSGYSISGGGTVYPGDNFGLYLDVLNESESITVNDVVVSLRLDNEQYAHITGSNSRTYSALEPGAIETNLELFSMSIHDDCPNDTNLIINMAISTGGHDFWEDSFSLYIQPDTTVGISPGEIIVPCEYSLRQNFPNPFNPTTTIQYSLPEAGTVKLTVLDIRGQEVITLKAAINSPGNYDIQWNGMDRSGNQVSTGIYFARLDVGDPATTAFGGVSGGAGKFSQTIKMLMIK